MLQKTHVLLIAALLRFKGLVAPMVSMNMYVNAFSHKYYAPSLEQNTVLIISL